MKIIFITRKFPPSVGGMETFAYDLYSSLKKDTDVSLVKYSGTNKLLPIVYPYLLLKAFFKIAINHIDVIHVQDGLLAPVGVILGGLFNKPFTVVIHGLDVTYENRLFQFLIPASLKKADRIFCISEAAALETVKRGINRSKIKVIPLGITDDHYIKKEQASKVLQKRLKINDNKTPILLTVGRLVRRKGVAWFVDEVFPQLKKDIKGLIYLVPGEGNDRASIEEVIRKRNLEKSVILLGRVDDEFISALYNTCSVFVMPNIPVTGDMEGFGRVLLEASLCEKPIVASGIEGIRDAIDDKKNGILVDPNNSEAFRAEILYFLNQPDFAENFGKNSRKFTIKKYNWKNISKQYIESYREILNTKNDI